MVRHESRAGSCVALLLLIRKATFSCIFCKAVHFWTLLQQKGLPDDHSRAA